MTLEDSDGKRHGSVRRCSRDSSDANVWVDWADGTSSHVPAALLVPGAPTQRRPAQSRRRRKPEPDSTSSESEPELESESEDEQASKPSPKPAAKRRRLTDHWLAA